MVLVFDVEGLARTVSLRDLCSLHSGESSSTLQREARPTMATAPAHATVPIATSAHMVGAMIGKSTRAPKMHIAAAPASRKAPGSSSQAAYHVGCTASPRSKRRAATNKSAAAQMAGTASWAAHPGLTDPVAAPMTGCTPARGNPAGTANATTRNRLLAGGIPPWILPLERSMCRKQSD